MNTLEALEVLENFLAQYESIPNIAIGDVPISISEEYTEMYEAVRITVELLNKEMEEAK